MENQSGIKILSSVQDKPPDDTLPPGTLLNHNKYRIECFLGRGGFGVTYMALDRTLGLRVAVKECLPRDRNIARRNTSAAAVQWGVPAPEQKTMLESFVKEARKMAKIDQIPGVVRVREYFYDNNTAYIVMDYVDGETLTQRLSRTRQSSMSAEECFRLLSPVMDSLALAHGRGLIHRDITPNNIMIEKDGEKVWLLDFGAAKDLGTRDFAPNVSNGTQIVGTPGYMPPEQYDHKGKIGPWTDIYALSAVFVRCIIGHALPLSTSRDMEEVPKVLRSRFGKVGAALLKGLAQKPEKRYQTMTELRAALNKALQTKPDIPKKALEIKRNLLSKAPQTKPNFLYKVLQTRPNLPKNVFLLIDILLVLILIPLFIILFRQLPPEIVASGECGENVSWTLDKNGLLTISGTGDMLDYPYNTGTDMLDAPWFDNKDAIFSVHILEGITDIGDNALRECGKLKGVIIPDSVSKIGWGAFVDCTSLTSITIPDSVTKIGDSAFYGCTSLASVTIPDSVTEVNLSAFEGCTSLASVTISNSVTEICWSVFSGCTSLASVTIPYGVTEIDVWAFRGCTGLRSVTIPDSVTYIGWGAFDCPNLASVSVPAGAIIEDGAFNENTTVTRR